MRHYRPCLAALMLLSLAPQAWADEPTYAIKLHRASTVGEVYKTEVSVEQTQTTIATMPQMPPQSQTQSTRTELLGQVKVLSVNDKDAAASLTLKIEKFTDDTGRELLEHGKIVEITRDAKGSAFTIQGGGDVAREARGILNLMFPAVKDTNEDDVFGSKEPRKVGDTWPIDTEKAAKDASKDGLTIDPRDITGKTTLVKVENVKNVGPALRISAFVEIKNLKPTLPPGATLESAAMKAQLSGLFPVDAARQNPETTITMDMTLSMTANGSKVETSAQMKLTEKVTPAIGASEKN